METKEDGGAARQSRAAREEAILAFWKENRIFEKSLEKTAPNGEFIFYEGPPTANGRPGIHHLEARAFKDAIPRYRTMRGYHVRRKAGWDTHGLPVELEVEKQLGLRSKKEIERYGIAAFNRKCKESVWKYLEEWNRFTERIGFWIDQEHPYVTYAPDYIESLWHILKKADERGLLYKDYKVVPWCPRCGTALSSHELAQGYKTVIDTSVYAKFRIREPKKSNLPAGATLVAWTTTPWTLPGNIALAVGADIVYALIEKDGEPLIVARDLVPKLFGNDASVSCEFSGRDLVGLSYEPLYPYLEAILPEQLRSKIARAYRVYAADFVSTEDGTGIVHTAVMYGADDFALGTAEDLPKHHIVGDDGTFIAGTDFLAGRQAKETDDDIARDLESRGLLLSREPYEHAYPFCWRCKTALIYYARDSWYIRMSALREDLVRENRDIHWEPEHIRDGRFGEWLTEIKDWAISRERYWGTPLPVWESETGERVIIDSVATLKRHLKSSGNVYFLMRHGEADNNLKDAVSSARDNSARLTERGKEQVREAAKRLRDTGIEFVYASPLARIKETVAILTEELSIPDERIIYDDRLREIEAGPFEHKTWAEYYEYFGGIAGAYQKELPGGENLRQVKHRAGEFLSNIDRRHANARILVVGHGGVLRSMMGAAEGFDAPKMVCVHENGEFFFNNADVRELSFARLPVNEDFELDLHRPYIDEVELWSETGARLRRAPEVMDVWFDSGAMPFAEDHYPFENAAWIEGLGYPADYISEAIDQTRGWFYTLHAVGSLMGRGKAFRNVICLGHILDSEGKKMSKSVGNVVDPWAMMEKYGVDALRFFMYGVNQPGDSKNFDEKTVDEIVKKVFNLLDNVARFYRLYAPEKENGSALSRPSSSHVLDRWILARLDALAADATKHLDAFHLFEPVREIREFIADLSQWYIRRSRDRFKNAGSEDAAAALATTRFVLARLSLVMAPFSPFAAEELYRFVRGSDDPESVHLAPWPETRMPDTELLGAMDKTRALVGRALEARAAAKIKVRQPLARLTVRASMPEELAELIRDEVNVEEIVVDAAAEDIVLDTTLNDDLRAKGDLRELIRHIQDLRKHKGFGARDAIELSLRGAGKKEGEFLSRFSADIVKAVNASRILSEDEGDEVAIGDLRFRISCAPPMM